MRIAASLLALIVALFGAVPSAAAAPRAEPKVVLIVGPAGAATERYRERAEAAARIAEQHTSNVVRLYSPNATWPAVRQALDGAAVVVYLGHGNGWPSRYRDAPYGVTQNGFGLNPVAGGGDDAHQYFGEDQIAGEVRLAENAVVLLHHLCYASGNTEPGLPEGTIEEARQRVVNYAAGFVRAGAGAVVAEGHLGPAWYMQQLLSGNRSIDQIWRASPNAHGNEFRFESTRSAGYVAAMDPDHGDRGFYRSIVYREGVGGARLEPAPAVTTQEPPAAPAEPAEPTLVGTGLQIGSPYLKAPPVAGAAARLWFPYETQDAAALRGLTVGVRWDPIDVAQDSAAEEGAEPEATNDGSEAAAGQEGAAAADDPEGTASPEAPADPSAGRITYIAPERLGDVVEPVAAAVGPTRMVVDVTLPGQPGRYRLVATLHGRDRIAYDAASQSMLPGLIVDVARDLDARYLVAESVTVAAGERLELPVGVANVGATAWGQVGSETVRSLEERPIAGVVVAHWIALDPTGIAPGAKASAALEAGLGAGLVDRVILGVDSPETPGSYLLVIDVVVPGVGSLASHGTEPAIVRVNVE